MASCSLCDVNIDHDRLSCQILNMGPELMCLLSESVQIETAQYAEICSECFDRLTRTLYQNETKPAAFSDHDINSCFCCHVHCSAEVDSKGGLSFSKQNLNIITLQQLQNCRFPSMLGFVMFRVHRNIQGDSELDTTSHSIETEAPVVAEYFLQCNCSIFGVRTNLLLEGPERNVVASRIYPRQVQKRLESNIKIRKSTRLTIYDTLRNISVTESPVKLNGAQTKLEHRRQQLEKWKVEKDKKKKEEAKNKKKPFVAGVAHSGLKYEPPPPPPGKLVPSTSGYIGGRVTRSQSAKSSVAKKTNDTKSTKRAAETSFAPKNATFKAPEIKNLEKFPVLAAISKSKRDKKTNISKITFDPITPKNCLETNSNMIIPMLTFNQAMGIITKQTPVDRHVNTRSRTNQTFKFKSDTTVSKPTRKPLQSSTSNSDMEQPSGTSTEKSPVLQKKVTPRRSIKRSSKNFTPKNPVPKSESSSEEKLRSPNISKEALMTPEQIVEESKKISPCVTLSRGKDNARKEMKKKIDEGLLDEDTSGTESIDHFRRQLNSEITRLTKICEAWDKISEQTVLPEPVQELVLAAVGQGRLLMSQKLQQFASLVERCAKPDPGSALVTPADLRGFWDVVFMQVENVDMRFKTLEELRSRNWVEEQAVVEVKKTKPQVKKAIKPSGSSRMREIIAAARKAKQQEQSQELAYTSRKTFEAGFFSVQSPIRSPALATPMKPTLLKAVLSNETKKASSASKSAASLAIMRASIIGKSVDDDMQQPTPTHLNPINLFATPSRSILKSSNVASTLKSGKKSIKVVLFDDSDVEQDTSLTNNKNVLPLISGVELIDINTDSGMSSMEKEKDSELKENIGSTRRTSKLIRQDATDDRSPIVTRSRRKSAITPNVGKLIDIEENTPKSGRKKVLQELEGNVAVGKIEVVTPKRSSRRRKSANTLLLA